MTLSSKKGIVKRIAEAPQGVELTDYIGLIADLVGFLSKKHETSERSILEMIAEGIEDRIGDREAA